MKHKSFIKTKHIVAGRNPLIIALEQEVGIDKILMARQSTGDAIVRIKALAKQFDVPIQMVPIEKINNLTNVEHQGIVAYKSAIVYQDLQQVIDWLNDEGKVPLIAVLDGITDVRNIGAIARSAVCCGVHAIVVPQRGIAALGEDAIKTSAGALEMLQICRVPLLTDAIKTMQLNGFVVCGSKMKASKAVHELDLTIPTAIVMGSEDEGISSEIEKICNEIFKIPMTGDFDSLNVSVAAGIIMYEAQRQRLLA